MKKILSLALCLLLCLSVMSVAGAEAATVKIGLIFPMSGGSADQGVFNVDAATLAMDEINAAGGIKALDGAQIELVIYDNESDSDKCKATAERLFAENPDVVAVHGASASAYVLPMLSVFEKNEVPFLTAQTSESITGQGYKYAFAFAAQSPQFAQTQVDMLNWLNETYEGLNLTKVGIVYEDTEWGLTNSNAARNSISASEGLELVYDQAYTPSASDLSSVVVGLMSAGVEVVFPTSYTQDAKLLFNTMVSYGYSPLIVGGGGGMLYPVFSQDLGDLVNGVLSVASHCYDCATIQSTEGMADVGARFEERFGYFMPEQGVSAYNAVYMVAQAIENCGSTKGEDVMNAVRALEITSLTPGGALHFEENGWNSNGVAVMCQWQKDEDGQYRTHTVFPASEATVEFQLTDLLKSRLGQ